MNTMALTNVCHGCLSADRKLTPIEEHAKLYHQLLLKKSNDKTKMLHMCWECQKTLNNIHTFRMRITQAQKLLSDNLPKAHRTLSNLTYLKKIDEYQIVIYKDEKSNVDDINIEIKDEKKDIEIDLIDVKAEYKEDDNFLHNNDNLNDAEKPKVELGSVNECDNDFDDKNDCFDDIDLPKVELPKEPKTQVKVEQGKTKRAPPMLKYKMVKMAELQDKRSFYDIEKINQEAALKWLQWKKEKSRKKNFQCSLCFCGFKQRKYYDQHNAKLHYKKHKYECDLCGARFSTLSKLRPHIIEHYVQYKCKLCALVCPDRSMIYVHLGHISGPHSKQMECRVCGLRFDCNKARQFYAHYRTMHGSKICDYCGFRCSTKTKLAHHIKCRHAPVLCRICGAHFNGNKAMQSLRKHNERRHVIDPSERNYCVECDVQFANSALYHEHVTRSSKHRVKPRIPCPSCDRTYARRCYMMNHYNLEHLKARKHVCTICDKSFLTGHRLRCHVKFTHEKVPKPRNYMCKYCDRGFNTRKILENHERTHTGERPFSCAHCPAAFAQAVALKTHARAAHK